jgi:hypothetical protein
MKKLLTMFVMLLVWGVCAPSYGYILIYNVNGSFHGFDATENKAKSVAINGFLFLDMNDTNQMLAEAQLLLLGKDNDHNKVFFVETFSGDAGIDWDVRGDFITLDLFDRQAPFNYEFKLTSKISSKNVGFGNNAKKEIARGLSGDIVSWEGIIFDLDQSLFGSGDVSMSFYAEGTKNFNKRGTAIDDIVEEFRNYYIDNHYREMIIDR